MWWKARPTAEETVSPVPLTEDAERVFKAAVRVARLRNHEYIATEHLLLGIMEAIPNPARDSLEQSGISADDIRKATDLLPGLGGLFGPLPLTPWADRVLMAASQMSQQRGSTHANSDDLLSALANESEGMASALLARMRTRNE